MASRGSAERGEPEEVHLKKKPAVVPTSVEQANRTVPKRNEKLSAGEAVTLERIEGKISASISKLDLRMDVAPNKEACTLAAELCNKLTAAARKLPPEEAKGA